MLPKAINQMTVPHMPVAAVVMLAQKLGCVGVELRNDLGRPLFDGHSPEDIRAMLADAQLRLLAVAEVKAFNVDPLAKSDETLAFIQQAKTAGSEAVALIPHVGTTPRDRQTQRDALRTALIHLLPMLEDHGMVGLIEPIGFTTSSLRHKADAAAVLTELGRPACLRLVHDTFHHHLSGDSQVFADITGLVHMSGVTDAVLRADDMTDADRVLIDQNDRLGNVAQLQALKVAGYTGPASFECFAPEIHQMTDPKAALAGSFEFIASQASAEAA